MVEDFLRDHPGESFGPVAIAKVVGGGRSSGAVSNALDKLVDAGIAQRTQDKPRRFALTPDGHDTQRKEQPGKDTSTALSETASTTPAASPDETGSPESAASSGSGVPAGEAR